MDMKKVLYGLGMVVTGVGIGAVTALLYAPKSGKETRKLTSRKAEDGMDYVSEQTREIRADQYGIRTMLQGIDSQIKFEIILEGRIALDSPGAEDEICGIATLSPLDMAASKLLANSDRWNDDGVFNRDIIDLAMMNPPLKLLKSAIAKSEAAYGEAIHRDLGKAIDRLKGREGWLDRCMQAMAMDLPKAVVWGQIRRLRRALE